MIDIDFWKGKRVFVTGHTGFKGAWMSLWLKNLGCKVSGYSLKPTSDPALFSVLDIGNKIDEHNIADVCDYDSLFKAVKSFKPDIVFHLAAQSLVKYSYDNPRETYQTNVMGTVNLLDTVRNYGGAKATIIVTSDKCYENREVLEGYKESDPMGGFDPYSNSKGCSELVTSSYANSYFIPNQEKIGKLASVRAGNVIGGGDWSENRLIPDMIKSIYSKSSIEIRSPKSIRPWQHVLEPLSGYMAVAQHLCGLAKQESPLNWNFGPEEQDQKDVDSIVQFFKQEYKDRINVKYPNQEPSQHEAKLLFLNIEKAKKELNWKPKLNIDEALKNTIDWYESFYNNKNIEEFTTQQINNYQNK